MGYDTANVDLLDIVPEEILPRTFTDALAFLEKARARYDEYVSMESDPCPRLHTSIREHGEIRARYHGSLKLFWLAAPFSKKPIDSVYAPFIGKNLLEEDALLLRAWLKRECTNVPLWFDVDKDYYCEFGYIDELWEQYCNGVVSVWCRTHVALYAPRATSA